MTANLTKKERTIDIVFCIDGTGSMTPCIDKVKSNAKKFYRDLVDKMTNEFNSDIQEVNIKLITFRDYSETDCPAMEQSEWYELTNASDEAAYEKYLNNVDACGGGDAPEHGLEALYYAMTTDWRATKTSDRQVIVLFTDADAIPFGDIKNNNPNYPTDMVTDESEFINTWMCILPKNLSQSAFRLKDKNKRLVMFGPAGTQYESLASKLNRSQFVPVQMDAGLADIDFDEIVRIIAASASSV